MPGPTPALVVSSKLTASVTSAGPAAGLATADVLPYGGRVSESNGPGCLAIVAILGAMVLSVAAGVYGVAAAQHKVRSPPPPAGADVTEAQAQGLAPDQPPIGQGVAYADLQVNCIKKKGRAMETTLLARHVFGSPKLSLVAPAAKGEAPLLPSFDFENWSGYDAANASLRRLDGHPAEPFAADWKQHPCDTYQVFVARVLPNQHVILQGDHAWFGTREELASKAAATKRGLRERALLFGGIALLLWIVGLIAGRGLWANRSREHTGR